MSALGQQRRFDRVVVVCDGPQPDVHEQLANTAVEVVTVARSGVSAARNAGIAALDTDWVCFLDDDDLLDPAYLSSVEALVAITPETNAVDTHYRIFAATETPAADFVATSYATATRAVPSAPPNRDFSYMSIHGRSFDLLLERMRGSLSGTAVRRSVLKRAGGFPEQLRCAEDWSMYVAVARHTEWSTLAAPVVYFRHHPSSVTHSGGVECALDTLRAIESFWQPSVEPTPPHRPLSSYSADYRVTLRSVLDTCRRQRNSSARREALRLATTFLPRRVDRLLARIPTRTWNRLRRVRSWSSRARPRARKKANP
jgi:hypothetical protein